MELNKTQWIHFEELDRKRIDEINQINNKYETMKKIYPSWKSKCLETLMGGKILRVPEYGPYEPLTIDERLLRNYAIYDCKDTLKKQGFKVITDFTEESLVDSTSGTHFQAYTDIWIDRQ